LQDARCRCQVLKHWGKDKELLDNKEHFLTHCL
jgi:hypothetical protein